MEGRGKDIEVMAMECVCGGSLGRVTRRLKCIGDISLRGYKFCESWRRYCNAIVECSVDGDICWAAVVVGSLAYWQS